ncbi:hypothetical protein [Singulisphaera acidiphila]|uniref:hypothetical protein n=1 Tax=Singulisphaera acidiphila TaxID=466153 RepID=UPI0002472CD4|nr:hypothetical protein [Singulisphaera acidiphila]
MNQSLVDRLVNALLYEGYLLYPYRPSVKNRQRWSFGGLYPPEYTAGRPGADASTMQTQCLARGSPGTALTVSVRFLHLVARQVGELDASWGDGPIDALTPVRFVESLRVGDSVVHSWQEAVEREIRLDDVDLGGLAAHPRRLGFRFGAGVGREPVRDPSGSLVGLLERRQSSVEGVVELSAEAVGDSLFRITVRIENQTRFEALTDDREEVLMQTLVSTHTSLGIREGAFISLLDPPDSLCALTAGCRNEGTWPVLVGAEGDVDTILSSPIILYDYPQIAPESPGDLFDATEIDEILTLRIMTLSDDEKRAMAELDARGRGLLERTESLARGQLMELHGSMREARPFLGRGGESHGALGSD